ncbi:MAG: site-specific DNA-methyltransferase [Patescibacteria group bacterium]
MNNKEQKFYSILQDLFVGAKLEGDSGYVNLMNIKTEYFKRIEKNLKSEVKKKFGNEEPEDLYDKLYSFFDSYISDGGAIFFSSTPVYKNIYSKVYSNREDTALFWKTAKLYYVKSEANYKSIDNLQLHGEPEIAFDFQFDASLLKHKQANEKKELEFYFTGVKTRKGKKVIKLHVLYKNDNKYITLEEKLKAKGKDVVIKSLFNDIKKLPSGIILKNEGLDLERINFNGDRGSVKAEFIVSGSKNNKTKIEIIPAVVGEKEIEKYLRLKGINLSEEEIKKAYRVYKKQTEIDYFIHRDAKGFLREQFDLFIYQYLANDLDSLFKQEDLDRIKKLKEIAYQTIEYIGNFEDELKKMWLKPKFARKSNYVVTLDRLTDKTSGMKVIEKIIGHKNFKDQICEWIDLGIMQKDFNKKEILVKEKLSDKWSKLPVDTKFFKDIEIEIIGLFDNLDEELDGRLIKSDNFQALNTLLPKYKGEVQTIYIDPPFNTGEDFDYLDKFQDSSWLTLMDNRLDLVDNILKDTGSLFLHLDRNADYYGRYLLNKSLLDDNFKAEITWDTTGTTGFKNSPTNWIKNSDNIFHFCNNQPGKFNKLFTLLNVQDPNMAKTERKEKNIGWLDLFINEKGTYIELWENGIFEKKYIKVDNKLEPIGMIWTDILSFLYTQVGNNESYFFSGGQKPENLLRRILQSSSDKGDIVLDFFLGIGTTIAVAHKLNRKWIGVEMGEHFNDFYNNKEKIGVLGRMKIVLFGDQVFHVYGSIRHPQLSRNLNWQGGGFFKYYELEQYEDVLKNASYRPNEKKLENIDFSLSEKQAKDGLEIDFKKEKAKFTFEKLYPDVDIAETISNLEGKKIKKILKDKVVFADDTEIDLNNLDFEEHKNLQKLIYW